MYAVYESSPQPPVSPFIEDVGQETLKWVFRFQLIKNTALLQQLEQQRFHELAARCYPNSPQNILQMISDWMTWFYALETCPSPDMAYSYDIISTLSESAVPEWRENDPLFASLLDLWERMQVTAPLDWLLRFSDQMAAYFDARLWQTQVPVPATADYIEQRRKTGRVPMLIGWAALTENIDQPVEFFDQPLFDELYKVVGDILCWTHDLLAVNIEGAEQHWHNLVVLLQRDFNVSLQEAFDITDILINDRVDDCLHLESKLNGDVDTRAYLGVLRSLIRGHLDWMSNRV